MDCSNSASNIAKKNVIISCYEKKMRERMKIFKVLEIWLLRFLG